MELKVSVDEYPETTFLSQNKSLTSIDDLCDYTATTEITREQSFWAVNLMQFANDDRQSVKKTDVLEEFQRSGRFWFRDTLTSSDLAVLDVIAELSEKAGKRIEANSAIIDVLSGDSALGRVMSTFHRQLVPVRIVAFSKTQENNWGVPWHQDRVISVAQRHDLPSFTNWTRKSEAWHCEPPREVLNQMFFVRVHLDDTSPSDGAMRIVVGSHKEGKVPSNVADTVANRYPIEDCRAQRGDVLVLNMLTLHSSGPSSTSNARRVLRVDYAPPKLLPPPLTWTGKFEGCA